MQLKNYEIIKKPMLTEESTILMHAKNQYVFQVDPRANKQQIRAAIEQVFKVTVTSVNTMNYAGKVSGRRGRALPGRRANWKKAIVSLKQGETIDFI
jgi:large subunit ribosomal protein L23